MNPAATDFFLQTPINWKLRIHEPILSIAGAKMENSSQCSFTDHFLCESNGWNAPVIMADHVHDFRFLRGVKHRLCLFHVHRERFFTQHMFSILCGGYRDFSMRTRRRDNVDNIDER